MLELDRIYCGDNCNLLGALPRHSIDLVVTSPPYDDLRNYSSKKPVGELWDFYGVAWQLSRVLKDGGVIVWVVADQTKDGSESGSSFEQALHFKKLGLNLHDTMIYMKDNPVPVGGGKRYYQQFEYMFVFSNGKPKTFNQITRERRYTNDKRTSRVKGFVRNRDGSIDKRLITMGTGDVKVSNIWGYLVGGGNSVEFGIQHPATFPIKMAIDHISSWSNAGDIVLDPFMGSGTTAIAAKLLDRRYIGFEISRDYCNVAEERLGKLNGQNETL